MNAAASSRVHAFVAFGANLGDPAAACDAAARALDTLSTTRVIARSSLYRTAPLGTGPQPDYYNAVFEITTSLSAERLLALLLELECQAGRTRTAHRAPRTLDLDLLLYDEEVIDEPHLQLPHPRMHERAFVLVPLAEIAPDIIIPGHGPLANLLPSVATQAIERQPQV